MSIHLKKNRKIIITIVLLLLIIFILIIKNTEKSFEKFDSSKYLENLELDLELDNDDFNIFFLNHKNLNEKFSLENSVKKEILPRVAHAGGGFEKKTYTNSIDALEANKKDFLFFELDFFITGDNKVVCEHDFSENLENFNKFKKYIAKNLSFEQCTYLSLKKWLKENPNKIIITDFKNRNIDGLTFISKNFNNYEERFIPQIYHPKEYNKVKKLGYKNIIWTLYRSDKSNEAVLSFASNMNLYAITMSPPRARSGLAVLLKDKKIKTYVHTINSVKEYFEYVKMYKVDQIYTDWIK